MLMGGRFFLEQGRSSRWVCEQVCNAENGVQVAECFSGVKFAWDFYFYTTLLTCVDNQHLKPELRITVHRTSKNLFSHHTWKTPSAINTPSWKIDHHLTLAFVLSAVFLCVRSRTTM